MNESPPRGRSVRGLLAVACASLLLCAVSACLLWSVLAPVGREASTPTALPAPTGASGTLLPAGVLATPSTIPCDLRPATCHPSPPASASVDQQPPPARAALDLARLFTTTLPALDYFAAAEALGRAELGERTVPPATYQIGDRLTFQTAEGPRQAELVYLDDLAAYWVETGLPLDRAALAEAAERLRADYYPLLSRNFGQEWRPGVDGDPRLTVLHVLGPPDAAELGYFTDEDQYPRALFAESNEREMVTLNMSRMQPGDPLYDGTLVHEVQHLIQWNLDANEDTWLNEGLSQIAETMAGLDTVDWEPYLDQPHVRLDRWYDFAPDIYARYGGSYLYLLYLWEQAGDAALQELARHPDNGFAAIRAVLAGHRPDLTLERFTGDWAAALYLDGESADPRYQLVGVDLRPPLFANRARQLPFEAAGSLEQYTIAYIDLDFSGPAVLSFAGDTTAPLTAGPPPGGDPFWFAPPANSSRAQLTAALDLTGLGAASLTFDVWYDLEPDYDFAYLSVSTDGGQTWELLTSTHATLGSFGPAWGGLSAALGGENGWVRESIRLDAYAGQRVLVRFDMVTDFETFGRGFGLAGLSVPELAQPPVWEPAGFVETGWLLPQQWEVRLIREGATPEVIPLALDAQNGAQLAVELGADGGVLAVMPLTPFVDTAADYWVRIDR